MFQYISKSNTLHLGIKKVFKLHKKRERNLVEKRAAWWPRQFVDVPIGDDLCLTWGSFTADVSQKAAKAE